MILHLFLKLTQRNTVLMNGKMNLRVHLYGPMVQIIQEVVQFCQDHMS